MAAERERALQAEAEKRIAEAKITHLEHQDTVMASTVHAWKASTDVDRQNLFEQLKMQNKQVEQLVAANNERTVNSSVYIIIILNADMTYVICRLPTWQVSKKHRHARHYAQVLV